MLALLCSIALFICVCYMKMSNLFWTFLHFFAPHFGSCTPTVLCPAVTLLLSAPLFCFSPHLSLFVSSSLLSLLSSSLPLLLCAMPQGPPGPQGSPHPQPPPPNSMMGPHSQVTLPRPLSLFFSVYALCGHLGTLVLDADASCFGIRLSSMLYAASNIHQTCC